VKAKCPNLVRTFNAQTLVIAFMLVSGLSIINVKDSVRHLGF